MAVELGADLIGLNLVAGPRKIPFSAAMEIAADPSVRGRAVLLLGDWPAEWDHSPPEKELLAGVQFYGPMDHPAVQRLVRLRLPIYFPLQIRDIQSLDSIGELLRRNTLADVLWLLDSHVPGKLGGSGQVFDWSVAVEFSRRFIQGTSVRWGVAGGLTPHNVADAIRELAPDLVDVSSGVEEAGRPGIKRRERVREFIAAVCRGKMG